MVLKTGITLFLFLWISFFQALQAGTLDNQWDFNAELKHKLAPLPWQQWSRHLRPGDVIMVPLHCWVCRLIEAEIGRPFSHSAVVIAVDVAGEVYIAEALGTVRITKLSTWAQALRTDAPWVVVRAQLQSPYQDFSNQELSHYFYQRFDQYFSHLSFDPSYSWDSFDDHGQRTLYCSEFIYHFLSPYLAYPLQLGVASYRRHYDLWKKYFNGEVPAPAPGINPGAFYDALGFDVVIWQKAQ